MSKYFSASHLQQERSAEVEEIHVERCVAIAAEVKVFVFKGHGVYGTRMVDEQVSLQRLGGYTQVDKSTSEVSTKLHFIDINQLLKIENEGIK